MSQAQYHAEVGWQEEAAQIKRERELERANEIAAEIAASRAVDCPECDGRGWILYGTRLRCQNCDGCGYFDEHGEPIELGLWRSKQ